MKHEDDFISKLMDETYNQVEHPSNELSNQSVVTLSDYFNKREESADETKSIQKERQVSVSLFKGFLRISVDGTDLDIPEDLNWVSSIDREKGGEVFELKDETFVKVISELWGNRVKFIVVQEKSAELYETLPKEISSTIKAA